MRAIAFGRGSALLLSLLAVALASCGAAVPDPSVIEISGTMNAVERQLAVELVREAKIVLASDTFDQNLRAMSLQHPLIYAGATTGDVSLDEAADAIRGLPPHHYVRTELRVVGGDETGLSSFYAGTRPVGGAARITLGRAIVREFQSVDPVLRSCAVHTVAHEVLHTISHRDRYEMTFTDTTRGETRVAGNTANLPIGTYLAASVAQCTYLQKVGRIAQDEVRECVKVFGVRQFSSARCRSFFGRGRIAEVEGLPPPAPSL